MFDPRNRDASVDEACARLRSVLVQTLVVSGGAISGACSRRRRPDRRCCPPWPRSRRARHRLGAARHLFHLWWRLEAGYFGRVFRSLHEENRRPGAISGAHSFAKLRAMHEAKAQQIDIAGLSGMDVYIAARIKMISPIDWSLVDKSALDPQQLHHENVIGCSSQSMNICYSKKKWPNGEHPNSWADFWNVEKFPGRRALRRDAFWTMEAAAKADGIKDDAFYPLDVDRVFRTLDRIKPHIKAWWSDNSLAQQLMEQDEVDLIYMTNGRATQSILDHKAPYEMIWNEAIYAGMPRAGSCRSGHPIPRAG